MSVYVPSARKAETGSGVLPMMYDPKMSDIFGKNDHARLKAAQLLYHANPWINAAERAVTSKFANVEWHLEDENDDEITDESKPGQVMARDLIEKPQANLPRNATQNLTRRALWSITSRHMGLCGTTFWYGDQLDLNGIPAAFLYINPCRMTPVSNPAGYLIGYKLDAQPYNDQSGYPLTLEEVFKFDLDPGDMGHWGIGLAEAAGILGELFMLAAKHSGGVLSSGGRLAGIMMPKEGVVMEDDAWKSLVRDMRTISEDPNAAKRNLIVKQPMDFLPTAAKPSELDLVKSLELSRDDILAYWGVPKSQVGLDVPSGLNSGSTKDRDLQVLWQGAVHSRLVPFAEVIQYQLLDRFKALGLTLELEVEEPDFTEDKPKFDNANTALSQPLRNRERRELLGLDPFGDPILDNAVWMPSTMVEMFGAPDEDGVIHEEEDGEEYTIEAKAALDLTQDEIDDEILDMEEEIAEDGQKAGPKYIFGRLNAAYTSRASAKEVNAEKEAIRKRAIAKYGRAPTDAQVNATYKRNLERKQRQGIRSRAKKKFGKAPSERAVSRTLARNRKRDTRLNALFEGKASTRPLLGLRRQVDATWVPKVRKSMDELLADQRAEVVAKVKRNAAHLSKRPTDTATWWDARKWDKVLADTLKGHASGINAQVTEHVAAILGDRKPAKAAPEWADEVEARVFGVVGRRITGINETTRDDVLRTIENTVARGIQEGMGAAELGNALESALNDAATFDTYRAELIARTETMNVYNASALGSYGQYGVERVQALDGDKDEECAARDGKDYSLAEANDISDHPNGTLDWVPYFAEAA